MIFLLVNLNKFKVGLDISIRYRGRRF
jgi:hypothetical protein